MILKLKRTPGLYLVGFMGCGKTTIGRLLANRIGWQFADLDHDIEKRTGSTIQELFSELGEPEFRRIEAEALHARVSKVECGMPLVMALGGGAFVQPDNFAKLERCGVSIFLDTPLEIIEKRVNLDGSRPLARDLNSLRELHAQRRSRYMLADFHVSLDHEDPDKNLESILALPIFD